MKKDRVQKDLDPILPTVETGAAVHSPHSPPLSPSPIGPSVYAASTKRRSRASSTSSGGSSVPNVSFGGPILVAPPTPAATLAPGSPTSPAATAPLASSPSFRRHFRQRSSTIYVAPRPVPPVSITGTASVPQGLIRGVTTLAGAQVCAKLLAFLLNQILIRFLDARDLGAASQLDLLVSTALVLSRDAIRLASQRQTVASVTQISGYTTDAHAVLGTLVGTYQETANLGWVSVAVGTAIVSLISSVLYIRGTWRPSVVYVAAAASLVELLAEPGFLVLQLKLQLAERARAETLANTARALTVAVSLLFFHTNPFLGFACGHLAYALVLAGSIYGVTRAAAFHEGFSLLPRKVWNSTDQKKLVFTSEAAWNTSLELGAQQVVKLMLTEGDKLAVSVMTTLEQQGQYALAANYGSLLARMVFSPVEEALRSYFSRAQNASNATIVESDEEDDDKAGASGSVPSHLAETQMVLASTLRAYAYLGIFAAGFGPLAARYLLRLVVRAAAFKGADAVLAAYCYYIPVMAWNGVLESLVQSTAPLSVVRWQGMVLAALALTLVVLTYVFVALLKLGGAGIVWAQLATMILRTAWSMQYATQYFSSSQYIAQSLPNAYVCGAAVVSIASAWVCLPQGASSLRTLAYLVAFAAVPAGVIGVTEGKLIKGLYSKLSAKKKTE